MFPDQEGRGREWRDSSFPRSRLWYNIVCIHQLNFQKVHQFQQSVEAVMHILSEAERNGGFLSNQGVSAKTDTDVNDFRNRLKASTVVHLTPSPLSVPNPCNFPSYCLILGIPLSPHCIRH